MKRKTFTSLLSMAMLFILPICVMAQEDEELKPAPLSTVFIDEVTGTSGIPQQCISQTRANLLASIAKTQRVIMIDGESEEMAQREDLRRSTTGATTGDANAIERMKAIETVGAEYRITANVNSITTKRNENKDKNTGQITYSYTAKLTYSVKVVRVSDGTIVKSETYDTSSTSEKEWEAKDKVMEKGGDFGRGIEEYFILQGTLLDVHTTKKNRAEEVIINIGSDHSLKSGTHFNIYIIEELAGRKVHTTIGRLKVTNVKSGDMSICEVLKKNNGRENVLKTHREGKKMYVESYYFETLGEKVLGGLKVLDSLF